VASLAVAGNIVVALNRYLSQGLQSGRQTTILSVSQAIEPAALEFISAIFWCVSCSDLTPSSAA
jgi:hypothetical protein